MGYTPPQLYVNKVSGGYSIYPPTETTGDDLKIYSNTTDATPFIVLYGGAYPYLVGTTSNICAFGNATTEVLRMTYSTPDISLVGKIADKNIFLQPAGTGVVKFGTYTAGAATDSTGYITILDAAGNTRKLMVQA